MSTQAEKPHHLNEFGWPIDAHGYPIQTEIMDDSGWAEDEEEDGLPALPPELLKALEADGIIDEAGRWVSDGKWSSCPWGDEKVEDKKPATPEPEVSSPPGGTKSARVATFEAAMKEDLGRLRASVGEVVARASASAAAEAAKPAISFSPVVKLPPVILDVPQTLQTTKAETDLVTRGGADPRLSISPVSYRPPDQDLVKAQRFAVSASSVHIEKSRLLPPVPPPIVNVAAPIVHVNVSPTPLTVENNIPAPIVNVAASPAPIVNVAAAESPVINVAAPNVHVAAPPAPIVNVQPPNVHVDVAAPPAPIVNVAAPNVSVEAPSVKVNVAAQPAPIVNVAAPNVQVDVAAAKTPEVNVNVVNEVKLPPPRPRTATVTSPDGVVSEIKIA